MYLNRVTGEEVVGREAIAEEFTDLFKDEPDAKMTVVTESIEFVSPNVAVEHGTSTMTFPKGKPEDNAYSAVYVKRDGQVAARPRHGRSQSGQRLPLRAPQATGMDGRPLG